jgi:predicted nucleic acid-binding protein
VGVPGAAPPEEIAGVLLDTNVIIEILRKRRAVFEALTALEGSGVRTYTCAVSAAEVWVGLLPGEHPYAEGFFGGRGEVLMDGAMGRRAGAYLARYRRTHGLDLPDALIAAAATTTGLWLWTLNRRHFPMPDVRFYEPPG